MLFRSNFINDSQLKKNNSLQNQFEDEKTKLVNSQFLVNELKEEIKLLHSQRENCCKQYSNKEDSLTNELNTMKTKVNFLEKDKEILFREKAESERLISELKNKLTVDNSNFFGVCFNCF